MRKPGESVYCLSFWRDKFKGKSGDEPYFDVAEDGISAGKVMRIYVDAKRFPTWQKWKDEADKARACAYIGNASMCGYFVKGGTSYPLSASPAFMIEGPEFPGLDTILWINVLCPNESEFHWAVEEAKKTAELKAKNLAPSELYAPFNNVQYRHQEAAESDIDAFLRRNGVTPATAENDGAYDGAYGRKIYGPVPDDIKKQPVKIGGIPIYPYLLHDRTTFMSALPAIALLRHIKRTNEPILQIFFETDYACGDSGQPATGLFRSLVLMLLGGMRIGVGEPDDQRMRHVDLVVNHKSRKLIGLVIHTPERDYFVTPQLFERLAPVLTAENGFEKTEASDAGHT